MRGSFAFSALHTPSWSYIRHQTDLFNLHLSLVLFSCFCDSWSLHVYYLNRILHSTLEFVKCVGARCLVYRLPSLVAVTKAVFATGGCLQRHTWYVLWHRELLYTPQRERGVGYYRVTKCWNCIWRRAAPAVFGKCSANTLPGNLGRGGGTDGGSSKWPRAGERFVIKILYINMLKYFEISGSHSGEYEDGCLLGCCAV
jgi:hypothetical protein